MPAGAWVAAFWSAIILMRTLQRPDALRQLFDFQGNIEDGPLLITAVVTTLGAFLLSRAPLAALAVTLTGSMVALGTQVAETPVGLFLLADGVVGYVAATRPRRVSIIAAMMPVGVLAGYATTPSTYGITGMRERVSLLHGDFSAGPREEGGFRVSARLPVEAVR